MFQRIKKHLALKGYIKKLGPELRHRYGKLKSYTPAQVNNGIQISGLNEHNVGYAYVLFCKQSAFNKEFRESKGEMDYKSMKKELADKFFQGEQNFNISDVISTGNDMNWDSSDGGISDGWGGGDVEGGDGK